MQFIEDFKQKVGKWVFLRELKNNKRSKSVCNLSNAKSIGILYDATNESQINEINVVPYVDVMLVLLVVFMVTAPLLIQGIKIDLPETTASVP